MNGLLGVDHLVRGLLSQPQRAGARTASRNTLGINHPLAESSPVARIPLSMMPFIGGGASGYTQEDLATLALPEETTLFSPLGFDITDKDLARFGLATDALDWVPGAAILGGMATGAGLLGRAVKGNRVAPESDEMMSAMIGPAMQRQGLLDDATVLGPGGFEMPRPDPGAPDTAWGGGARSRALETSSAKIIDGPDWDGGARDVTQVAEALEQRTLGVQGGAPLLNTPHNVPVIGSRIAEEAAAELTRVGNAGQWYRSKMDELHDLAAQRWPETASDPYSRAGFDYALAVTSNGQSVDQNVLYAKTVYDEFRKTGKFPTHNDIGWGKEADKMRSAFEQWNDGVDEFGKEMWVRAMDTDFTVGELTKAGLKVGGLPQGAIVKGSAIAGPKIGAAFYQNIRGNRKPVTKDLWFTRMFNRIKGDMYSTPEKVANSRKRLTDTRVEMIKRKLLTPDTRTPDKIAKSVNASWSAEKYAKQAGKRARSDKRPPSQLSNEELWDEMNAAARTHAANLKPREAPANGGERVYMDETIDFAINQLRAKGLVDDDFQPADLQALVWFPEKVLYAKMGAKDSRSAPTDYSIEMRKLNEQDGINGTNRNNGPRRPGLGAQHAGRAEGNSPTYETSVLSEIERDQFLGRTRAPPTYGPARQLDLYQGGPGLLGG